MLFTSLLFIILTLTLASMLILSSCSTQQNNSNELVVGTCAGFPPYEILANNGDIIGFDIDVMQKIAEKLNKQLIIKDMAFDALLVALKQNKIDAIIAGISITQSRLAEISMVHYHGKPIKTLPILFWKEIPAGVKTIADLATQPNKTVCAQVGTIQEEILSKYTYLDIKNLENIPDLILDIKHSKSIAAVVEPMVVAALQEQMPEIKTLELELKPDEQDMGHGIGINKNNKTLFTAISTIISQLKKDTILEKLEQAWFKNNGNAHDNK